MLRKLRRERTACDKGGGQTGQDKWKKKTEHWPGEMECYLRSLYSIHEGE